MAAGSVYFDRQMKPWRRQQPSALAARHTNANDPPRALSACLGVATLAGEHAQNRSRTTANFPKEFDQCGGL